VSLLHSGSRGFFADLGTPTFPHDPTDERAWSGGGPSYVTSTGLTVDYATALRVSCIFQGVRLIGQTMGSMPIRVLRDLGGGRKEEIGADATKGSPGAAIRRLLKVRPNSWQTPKQFQETLTAWSILWGQGLAEIKPGGFGAFDELWPIEPSWVTSEQIRATRRMRYIIDEPGQARRVLTQDEVFRVDGFGLTGAVGSAVLSLAREAIGLWVAHQKFEGLYFANGAKPSVWLQHPGPQRMDPEAYLRLKKSTDERYSGWGNHHRPVILEQAVTAKETGWNMEQSQSVEAKHNLVEEMARFLNLPTQFFMLASEPTHASAETFNQQAVDYTFMPHAAAWEQSAVRDLLLEDETDIVVKFVFDSLLRGKTLERAQAYAAFIMNGVMSENECRIREDLDPFPGLDEPRRSANQDRGADPTGKPAPQEDVQPPPRPAKKQPRPEESGISRQLLLIAEANAARVVRRELAAIADKGAKHASDPQAWNSWLEEFYRAHEAVVADALQLPPLLSRGYVMRHREALKAGGLAVAESWDPDAVVELRDLAVSAV